MHDEADLGGFVVLHDLFHGIPGEGAVTAQQVQVHLHSNTSIPVTLAYKETCWLSAFWRTWNTASNGQNSTYHRERNPGLHSAVVSGGTASLVLFRS